MIGDVVLISDARTTREEASRLAERLRARGASVRLLAIGSSTAPQRPEIVEAPSLARAWSRPWTAHALRKRVEFRNAALLHVLQSEWDAVAIATSESWELPYLLNVDEFLSPGERIRLSSRFCRGLIASCRELAEELREGLPKVPVEVVPPAFVAPKPVERDQTLHRVRVVGAAGPLALGSDPITFLEAARILVGQGADVEFVIAGEGPDEFELRRIADHWGIADRVTFTEDYQPDSPFWRVLDVFCQTAARPTSPRIMAIALAHAIPSIAVTQACPGAPADCLAATCPANDPAAFARSIQDLLDNPLRAQVIGRRGREWALNVFDPDRQADALVELYRAVLDDRALAEPRRAACRSSPV